MTETEISRRPTVGSQLWFRPGVEDRNVGNNDYAQARDEQSPMHATVCYAMGDRLVNLLVTDHYANTHVYQGVTLVHQGDPTPSEYEPYCYWPVAQLD